MTSTVTPTATPNNTLGASWQTVGSPDFSSNSEKLSLFFNGTTPFVGMGDNAGSAVMWDYLGGDWAPVGGSTPPVYSSQISTALYNGNPYVAFLDTNGITAMTWTGASWVTLGSPGFAAVEYDGPVIAVSPNGTPYVGFDDATNGNAVVMSYNGTSWVTVGSPDFTKGAPSNMSLAFDNSGVPYMACLDLGAYATVMKFDGTNWVNVGPEGMVCNDISLAIDAGGTPYEALSSSGLYHPPSPIHGVNSVLVAAYDGGSWVSVGPVSFGSGAYETTIAISPSGMPYVAFADNLADPAGGRQGDATVMSYNGSSWNLVGNQDFAIGAYNPSLAFDSTGRPTVAFLDANNGNKATVMSYH